MQRSSPSTTALSVGWIAVASAACLGGPPPGAVDAQTTDASLADSGPDAKADAAQAGADTQADTGKPDVAAADTAKADVAPADTGKPAAACKPWDSPSDWNCPKDTHCGYDELDVIACVADGSHGLGDDCSDGGGCSIGECVQAQNGTSACGNYCTVDAHCDSGQCNGIVGKKYKVCDVAKYVSCNPLGANKCQGGQACYLLNQGFVCVGAGSKPKGEKCKANYECAPGHTCTGLSNVASAFGICRKLCKQGGSPTGCDDPSAPCSALGGGVGYCEE